MEPQELLGVLLTMTEQQGQTVSTLLESLGAQVVALQKAAVTAQKAAEAVAQSAEDVMQAAQHAMPTRHQAVADAVIATVETSLADGSVSAAGILDDACRPVVEGLNAGAAAVANAQQNSNKAAASIGSNWGANVIGALVVTLIAFGSAVWLVMTLQRNEIAS